MAPDVPLGPNVTWNIEITTHMPLESMTADQVNERERDSCRKEGGRVVEQTKRAEVLLSRGQTAFSYKVLRDGTTDTTAATREGPQSGLRQ